MRLVIVRNPASPLLEQLSGAADKIVLIQDAAYSEPLRQKWPVLEADAEARGIQASTITAAGLVDEIFKAEKAVCI